VEFFPIHVANYWLGIHPNGAYFNTKWLLPPMTLKGHDLLHKIGENKLLSNWCPIMLLNITYKIFAKVF
jgi:hypothetical protein